MDGGGGVEVLLGSPGSKKEQRARARVLEWVLDDANLGDRKREMENA